MNPVLAFFERLKGYRTVIVSAVGAVFGLVLVIAPDTQFPEPEEIGVAYDAVIGGLVVIASAISILLRAITSTPLFKKE